MAKATKTQRDFSLGPVLPSFLDGDDLELRGKSVKEAKNVRVTSARTLRGRMGFQCHRALEAGVNEIIEMTPQNAGPFGLVIGADFLEIIGSDYELVQRFSSVPWTTAEGVWVELFGDYAIFGPNGIYALEYTDGSWTFGEMAFTSLPGGEKAQPYWAFNPGTTIQPSATTGSVTVTASAEIFKAAHVGARIRYSSKEIEITGFTDAQTVSGNVIDRLPPTYELTMSTVDNFAEGEIVVGNDSGWQGIITDISGSVLTCVTLELFEGPGATEVISGPNTTEAISSKATASAPAATTVWDEQLISAVRGYPRSAASVNGRLTFCDFPQVPDLIAISSIRAFNDFSVGLADDDAIVRRAGNNTPRFRHAISANDLILLSDKGCYYVRTRDGELLTPSNFQAVQFDSRGCGAAKPYRVDDAVVFVEAVAPEISACVLSGNVYLNWTVLPISKYHSHLISSPADLCGPTQVADISEKYLLVVNGDGQLLSASWSTTFGSQEIGLIPWETNGTVIAAMSLFNQYHAIVDRTSNGSTVRYLESLDADAVMDCCNITTAGINGDELQDASGTTITDGAGNPILLSFPAAANVAGQTVGVWEDDYFHGAYATDSSGSIASPPTVSGEYQVGLVFTHQVKPWPQEITDVGRAGTFRTRVIRLIARVRDTVAFSFRRNGTTTKIGPYRSFDSPYPASPPRKDDQYRFNVFGRSAHPDLEIFNDEPGPFELTAVTQEVQY